MVKNYKQISQSDYENIAGTDWPDFVTFQQLAEIPVFIKKEMDLMQVDPVIKVFTNNVDEYLNYISTEYLDVCKNMSVLEIGPGMHVPYILKHNPSDYTGVQPDSEILKVLRFDHPETNFIEDDIFSMLSFDSKFKQDVVVCFGVLYHVHSPLHLLELIVNCCDPTYIILDSVNSPDELKFNIEPPNISGNRFVLNNRKSCNFNLVAPFEIINQGLKQTGYTLIKSEFLKITDNFSKSNSWIGLWKKD